MMSRIFLLVLILVPSAQDVVAQAADTLDPKGYFPLAVGNVWEYEHNMYRPFTSDTNRTRYEKYEIIGREVVQDTVYFDLLFEPHREDGSLVRRDTSRLWFDSTTSSIRGENLPQIIEWLKCLDAPVEAPPEDVECWLTAERGEKKFFDETLVVKQFSNFVWGFTAGHGVGILDGGGGCEPCSAFDNHDSWLLRYAQLDGREYGVSIVLVEPFEPFPADQFLVYPNPTSGDIVVEAPKRGTLTVYDMLGRRLVQIEMSRIDMSRIDLGGYSPGIYILQFEDMTRSIVLR